MPAIEQVGPVKATRLIQAMLSQIVLDESKRIASDEEVVQHDEEWRR
jgi:hypothetical protein